MHSKYIIRISRHFKTTSFCLLNGALKLSLFVSPNWGLWAVKSSAVWINSQMTNKIVHAELFTLIVHVTEFLETKTECSTKPKLFHCHVFALARGGNNSTCLVLYTLRYFQVLYPWLFSWGSQVTNLEQSVIRAFLAGGTFTIINQPSLFNSVSIKHLQANPIIELRWRWLISRIKMHG